MADPSIDNLRSALEELTGVMRNSSDGMSRMAEANRASDDMRKQSMTMFTTAVTGAGNSLKSFATTVMNTERSFAKYGTTVDNVSGTLSGLLGNFGKFGQLLGGAVKGMGELVKLHAEQADKLNKATDELKKLGTAGSFTASQFLDLAHGAKITASNLSLLIKPIQSLGPNLLALGNNTGVAAKNFAEIAKYSDEELKRADRLGISQEELLQTTADYVSLQVQSGRATAAELKDRAKLQQLSLEYAENLQVISKVTGIEAAEAKKRTAAMSAEVNWQLYQRGLQRQGRTGEAAASGGFMETLSRGNFDPATLKAIQGYMATGVISGSDQAVLARIPGLMQTLQQARQSVRSGQTKNEGVDIGARVLQSLGRGIDVNAERLQLAGSINQKVAGKFALTGQNLTQAGIVSGLDLEKEIANARQEILKAEKESYDKAADARANLATMERNVATELDKLLKTTNPLIDGFKASTVAAYGLAAAAGAAAAALGAVAAGGAAGAAGGVGGAGGLGGGLGKAGALGRLGQAGLLVGSFAGGWEIGTAIREAGTNSEGTGWLDKTTNFVGNALTGRGFSTDEPSAVDERARKEAQQSKGNKPNVSEDLVKKMIMRHEGVRYEPYQDSRGLWTVGVGHLIGDGKTLPPNWNRKFSHEEVMALFDEDYKKHRVAAENIPGFDKFNSIGQAALTDLTFNMGPGWISKFPNTAKSIAAGDSQGAADGLSKSAWFKQVGNRAPTIVSMISQGTPKAEKGGIFSGSRTGYPVELHGNELVAPLNPSSLLTKLLTTPESEMQRELNLNNNTFNSSTNSQEIVSIMSVVAEKLDDVLYTLRASQGIQDKLLQYSRA